MAIPRGIRNNNPGNIRRTSDQWVGLKQPQTDTEFFQFTEALYGIRAIARILDNYGRRGIVTVANIIQTWAPSTENKTDTYIDYIAKKTGLGPQRVVTRSQYPELIAAMISFENGINPYSRAKIIEGIGLA
jgi:hypothetical protein